MTWLLPPNSRRPAPISYRTNDSRYDSLISLKFSQLESSDEGMYTCQVTMENVILMKTIQVNVTGKS